MKTAPLLALAAFSLAVAPLGRAAGDPSPAALRQTGDYVPSSLSSLVRPQSSELRELVERFVTDRDEILRFYDVEGSRLQSRRLHEFYAAWEARLGAVAFEGLGTEGRIDWILLSREVAHEDQLVTQKEARAAEMLPLLPFSEDLAALQQSRRMMEPVRPEEAARILDRVAKQVSSLQEALQAGLKPDLAKDGKGPAPLSTTKVVASRAVSALGALQESLEDWYKFYDGYDPAFGWWVRAPHDKLKEGLDGYVKFLREKVIGIEPGKEEPVVGDPIGRKAILSELDHEMVAYSPEELLAVANRELAWCDAELRKASREMGCGDDWKAAMQKVKQDHLQPGSQPGLVRDLALEAVKFVQDRDLVTVPPLAADSWRIIMMGPERQKVAPFFLGGPDIFVAFPTDNMDFDAKEQSLRANNVHFARATVFHELIPGHHLQYYYESRSNPHRDLFTTSFWVEGWSLWWEFQFYDMGFPKTPEDRMGMLFWRTHRCARIIFSLNFHLGNWTPEQCIDFLVDRVGHERASATGEVRRSFNGSYPPLYQAGYMLGALELRELHREVAGPKGMTDRQFHDAILEGGPMPIEMVRVRLKGEKPPRDFVPAWRFAGAIPPAAPQK